MKKETRQQYQVLVSFLGKLLGPSYEIVLHEINNDEIKMISIVNGEISNRIIENTISEKTLKLIKEKKYNDNDFSVNEIVVLKNSKKLRSSSMFIKENNKLVGMLCINFDDTQFNNLTLELLRVIHPDVFLKNFLSDIQYNILDQKIKNKSARNFSIDNVESLMENIFQEVIAKFNFPMNRLTRDEKDKIIEKLFEKDFFKLKSSIPFISKKLNCSISTVYRYVRKYEK